MMTRRPAAIATMVFSVLWLMCWDVGAVPQVGRLARFDTGASVYSAPMAISDDGRYVLAATFNGTSHVVIDRVSGGQRTVDQNARTMSGDGRVIVGVAVVNGTYAVRRENLVTGSVQGFPLQGAPPGTFLERLGVNGLSRDGNIVVAQVVDNDQVALRTKSAFWVLDATSGTWKEPGAGFGTGETFASFNGSVSANGRFVTWVQRRDAPAGCKTAGSCSEVWRYDLANGNRAVVGTNAEGTDGDGVDALPRLNADGRYLTWISTSRNLVGGVADDSPRLYWKDLATGEVRLLGPAYRSTYDGRYSISDNGQRIAWEAPGRFPAPEHPSFPVATVLVADIADGVVVDTADGVIDNIATNGSGFDSRQALLSGDGRTLAFSSGAQGLLPNFPSADHLIYIASLDAPAGPVTPPANPKGSLPTLKGDIPVVGDWDGDGDQTIGVFRDGVWLLRNQNNEGGVDLTIPWGAPGDLPVVGDWDGDGTDTIGVFRQGTWYLRNSNTPGPVDITFNWGSPGQIPIVGDWNGDGTDTIGVYRLGTWYLRNSNTAGPIDNTINWGARNDLPVVGDWNHDGTDTIGVYREGTWLLRDSNTPGGIDRTIAWGASSDIPIAGNWTVAV